MLCCIEHGTCIYNALGTNWDCIILRHYYDTYGYWDQDGLVVTVEAALSTLKWLL